MSDQLQVEKWVTLKDVQAYLGVGRETILQWISKRNMPAYKVGRLWKSMIGFAPAEHPMITHLKKKNRMPSKSGLWDIRFYRMKI